MADVGSMGNRSSEQTVTVEKRKATTVASYRPPEGLKGSIGGVLCGFKLGDILSARQHSRDFCETRADYITRRLRFLLLFFMLAVPAWIPVDYLTLSPEHFTPMMIARAGLTVFLLLLWLAALARPRPLAASWLMALTVLAPSLFYLTARWILSGGVADAPQAGYTAMPFMVATLMGLFPTTLVFGLFTMAVVLLSFVGLEFWLDSLTSVATLNMLWILCLICGITLWVQSGQLLMLLKLYRESTRDPLTGLINRRVLMNGLKSEVETGRPFTLLMFDLDRFKRVNDQHGHLMGDNVLKCSAQIIERELRKTDIVARFGGEEFMAMLPGMTGAESLPVAERIRKAFEQAGVETPEGTPIPISTSVGVTEYQSGETIQQTMKRADDLLYQAKEQGRNRVFYQYQVQDEEVTGSTGGEPLKSAVDMPAA
jgi:diguanylate cyclase (GGDEF)-like protein